MNIRALILFFIVLAVACKSPEKQQETVTAFTGATIIDGNGGTPLQDGVLLVRDGKVVAIGQREDIVIPDRSIIIDVKGKTIVPGLINGHGHVGDVKGIDGGNYSRDNVIDNLTLYARYGVTTVVSLGGDRREAVALRAVKDSTSTQRARLYIAGAIVNGSTSEEAMALVDSNHHLGVDIMKIRVDDNLGTAPKMPEDIYRAVINRAHDLGYQVASHLYYRDDARKLVDAGTDMLAHSIRDLPVDDTLIARIKQKNVSYCPTLTRELSTFVYGDTAEFFEDPFFASTYDSAIIKPLLDPKRQAEVKASKSAQTYQQQLPVAMANLKKLSAAGVPIVFGTDSGVPTRFIGYFEHVEMAMMAEAGLTPMQIIVSATKTPAEYLGLNNVGTLAPGHYADFIVLEADPLVDIRNMKKITAVYVGGEEVSR